jgi:hypothetical protein
MKQAFPHAQIQIIRKILQNVMRMNSMVGQNLEKIRETARQTDSQADRQSG